MTELSRAAALRTLGAAGLTLAATGTPAAASTSAAAGKPAGEHPNIKLIRGYYDAYARNDLTALRERFFAADIVWTIPGHHPLAGTKRGADEVLAFFTELARAGFRADPIALAADGDWVIDLHRGWSTRPEGLDILWALAFRIRGGRIAEAVNFAADQHAADAFFWRRYPLAGIPARLAPRAGD
ncbi:nuclear transport factor 2 family protein [Nonomuraea sp. NPDC050783]|uniref:nuclear transport factor 2 family protein n=1 Tax=Nonomuraea sp. NPDC050783 TaxID=3154634 RepID=UPI0034668292